MDLVIGHRESVTGTTTGTGTTTTSPVGTGPVGGGGVGDIYIIRPDGTSFEMNTVPGDTYQYAYDSSVNITFTTGLLSGTTGTFANGVGITLPGTSIFVTSSSVIINGGGVSKPFSETITGGKISWRLEPSGWTTPQGDWRVDVTYGQWALCVIQDPGTNTQYHPVGVTPTLHGVPHVGFFILATPPVASITGGMILPVMNGQPVNPTQYDQGGSD